MVNFEHRSNIGTHPALADGTIGTVNRMDSLIGGRPPVLSRPEPTHVPVGSLVTVTIGRNRGDQPMHDTEWLTFQRHALLTLVELAGDQTFGPFLGQGEWGGIVEDSAVMTALVERPFAPGALDRQLGSLAEVFGQEAIAWSFGPARLARP